MSNEVIEGADVEPQPGDPRDPVKIESYYEVYKWLVDVDYPKLAQRMASEFAIEYLLEPTHDD